MPDSLRRYTVSAVVNTDTGELVGTPVIRPGHEDYESFSTVKPLADTEQFRWVHVWAPDEDAAAADDALTADLRPGGDRSRPVAWALTGDAGLKPYSVAAVVYTRSGRPIGEPVAAEGHHAPAGATFAGRRGTRSHTEDVWARDRADAIARVFGNPDTSSAAGPRAAGLATGDAADQGQGMAGEAPLAQREWNRLAGLPTAARAALLADTMWNREYPPAYRTAYTATASRVAAAATEAAATNPGAWFTLHQLASSAGDAISRLASEHPGAPPADQRTVAAAQTAAATPDPQPPWRRVADLAAAGGHTAATLAGTLTATADILAGWRGRSGHAMAEGVTVDGQPARAWVGELLATVNRETATRIAIAPGRTAAQLAREDQASAVSPRTPGATSSGARTAASPAPASTATRRTR